MLRACVQRAPLLRQQFVAGPATPLRALCTSSSSVPSETSSGVVVHEASSGSSGTSKGGRQVRIKRMNIRVSPKKLNMLAKMVRGLDANEAFGQLSYHKRRKSALLKDVLKFAVMRADELYEIPQEDLFIAECLVNTGPRAKRVRWHGRGKVGKTVHRYSHLHIIVEEASEERKAARKETAEEGKQWYRWRDRFLKHRCRIPKDGSAAAQKAASVADATA